MKKILLSFIIGAAYLSITINAYYTDSMNEEEKQQWYEWADECEKKGYNPPHDIKVDKVLRIKLENTPQYKAKEKQEKIIDSLRKQIVQFENDVFTDSSYIDYKKDILNADLVSACNFHRHLTDAVCSTPSYKKWYQFSR